MKINEDIFCKLYMYGEVIASKIPKIIFCSRYLCINNAYIILYEFKNICNKPKLNDNSKKNNEWRNTNL